VAAQATTAEAVLQKTELHEDLKYALKKVQPKVMELRGQLVPDSPSSAQHLKPALWLTVAD
jgi:hypothetical protein